MSVYLTSACDYPSPDFVPAWLRAHADREGLALLCDDPAEAQCILFAETHPPSDPYFFAVYRHPLFERYRSKCVLYHDADRVVTTMPTISPSIERWQFHPRHKRTAHYVARICENDTIDAALPTYAAKRRYLYSFVGSGSTHRVRRELLQMSHPSGLAFMRDTAGQHAWRMSPEQKFAYEREYLELFQESDFILCPRGVGPCSYRLFEAMQLGRAPVIIADQWQPIPRVPWSEFALTVPEREISRLPDILAPRRHEALERGRMARAIWERHFAPSRALAVLAAAALELVRERYRARDAVRDYAQFLQPWHLRNLARYTKNALGRAAKRNVVRAEGEVPVEHARPPRPQP